MPKRKRKQNCKKWEELIVHCFSCKVSSVSIQMKLSHFWKPRPGIHSSAVGSVLVFFSCMYMYVYVRRVYVCMFTCVGVHMHAFGSQRLLFSDFFSCSPLYWGRVAEPRAYQFSLSWGSLVLVSQTLRLGESYHTHTAYMWVLGV